MDREHSLGRTAGASTLRGRGIENVCKVAPRPTRSNAVLNACIFWFLIGGGGAGGGALLKIWKAVALGVSSWYRFRSLGDWPMGQRGGLLLLFGGFRSKRATRVAHRIIVMVGLVPRTCYPPLLRIAVLGSTCACAFTSGYRLPWATRHP